VGQIIKTKLSIVRKQTIKMPCHVDHLTVKRLKGKVYLFSRMFLKIEGESTIQKGPDEDRIFYMIDTWKNEILLSHEYPSDTRLFYIGSFLLFKDDNITDEFMFEDGVVVIHVFERR